MRSQLFRILLGTARATVSNTGNHNSPESCQVSRLEFSTWGKQIQVRGAKVEEDHISQT